MPEPTPENVTVPISVLSNVALALNLVIRSLSATERSILALLDEQPVVRRKPRPRPADARETGQHLRLVGGDEAA